MSSAAHKKDWAGLLWSDWIPLYSANSVFKSRISNKSGLYRVRSSSYEGLVYVGQTGRDLKERTISLRNHSSREINNPPWNDPHTAAPVLWAYRIDNQFDYEVSVAETENLNYSERQCFEDFLLYLHRIENNYSTLANHGRFHPGWVRPSNRGAGRKMVRSSKPVSYDSIAEAVKGKKFNLNEWLGLKWSAPDSLAEVKSQSQAGIYKIFSSKEMLYCGETKNMTSRLSSHKLNIMFLNSLVSYHLMPGAPAHHLKEREVDMIGSYFEEFGYGPIFQYRTTGKKK